MFESYKNRDAKNEGHNWPGEGRRNYLHVLKIKKICPDFEKNRLCSSMGYISYLQSLKE